ncbi:hypothetical protein BT69DRAFT_1348404 [Atractiella rhizophila]|nr:hypothetical protein BT69DRAFT_1320592 [Atractiella rhizophila]KAH8925932.1 hypothetical protein BT69DRAFT_1348404 [Atractiella rhizophila]
MLVLRSPFSPFKPPGQARTIFSFFKRRAQPQKPPPPKPIIEQDDLFHVLAKSPIPAMRAKAERIKRLALCPVSLEKYGVQKHVAFDCPDCGFPTHASQEMWEEDEDRERYCWQLREINEDEHDLRSGRNVDEFDMPGEQPYDEVVSLANWDVYFYTRHFKSIDNDRSRRHVSKILTYPLTIASVLHQFSPYTTRNRRLTTEGVRSLAALRIALHPPLGEKPTLKKPLLPIRVFVVGARAESTLPAALVRQISYMFPNVPFHIFFVGPESHVPPPPKNPGVGLVKHEQNDSEGKGYFGVPSWTRILSTDITLTSLRCTYEEVHQIFEPFDPYHDVFFAFSPGFGFPTQPPPSAVPEIGASPTLLPIDPGPPQSTTVWHDALLKILSTKCALFCTGFSPADVERDLRAMETTDGVEGEYEWLLTPGENYFRSEKWEVLEADPRVMIKNNWGIWGIRGKRYDVREKRSWF